MKRSPRNGKSSLTHLLRSNALRVKNRDKENFDEENIITFTRDVAYLMNKAADELDRLNYTGEQP